EVLTKSVSTPSVILIPQQIKNKQDTANYLADILGLTEKEAYNYVTKKASNVRIHPKGRKISASQEEKLAALNIDGVYLAYDSQSYYPNARSLSLVLRF